MYLELNDKQGTVVVVVVARYGSLVTLSHMETDEKIFSLEQKRKRREGMMWRVSPPQTAQEIHVTVVNRETNRTPLIETFARPHLPIHSYSSMCMEKIR